MEGFSFEGIMGRGCKEVETLHAFYALKRICSARKGIKMSTVKASMAGAKKTY